MSGDCHRNEYNELLCAREARESLPFSYKVRDESSSGVKEAVGRLKSEFIMPEIDEDGRAVGRGCGRRRTSTATVKISKPGTGKWRLSTRTGLTFL